MGIILALAMTLIAGAAAWSFARSEAAASEAALQGNQLNTNDMLAEHFAVTTMYFGTTTSVTFMIYNTGSITEQIQSVRLYDSAGQMNIFYNSTKHSPCSGDCANDLKGSTGTNCKKAASSLESPSLTQTTVHSTNEAFYSLTIPGTATGCPSYSATFSSTDTYTVVVTGIYGNVQSFSAPG